MLSVAIITRNEEVNLARTLASVRFADEVVVVDSHSTDRTAEIARLFGATVIARDWKGFAEQKNFAINQCEGEWILSLDADEELTAELRAEIQALIAGEAKFDAYFINRRNYFLGRWTKYGGYYPDSKLRLFRRVPLSADTAPRFAERPVHETIAFSGTTAGLRCDLNHYSYPTLEEYIEHMNRYSTLGGELLLARGRTSKGTASFVWNILLVPMLTFLWNYGFRLGVLDGREGLMLHLYHSAYISWKYGKAWSSSRSA